MAEKIPIRVQHRRKSASSWRSSSEILLAGELGVESDTGKVKVGDGTSRYSSLQYLTGPKGDRGEKGDSITVQSDRQLGSGNTQVTFSDGTTIEIQKGQDGSFDFDNLSNEQIRRALGSVLNDYARASHTHDSADITNTTNRIGTSASANKVVKLDSRGFLDVITPNDNSPGNSVIVKSYMESKLEGKADSNHTHSEYLTQSTADDRYVRDNNLTNNIGEPANGNKVLQTDNRGHLAMGVDPTEDNHLVRKSYVDRAIREAIQNLNIDSTPPAPSSPSPEREPNNLPVMKTKNDFYQLTVEQVAKLSTLIDRAQNNIETINKVLSTHDLGNEIGVSGIQSVAIFRESKASYMARQWLIRNSSSQLTTKVDDAIRGVR